jgi:proteic killer suppression protein
MIRSFKCKETSRLFFRERSPKLPTEVQRSALRKLRMLNRAVDINDLKAPPGNRLKLLKGDRKGSYSIRINEQFRICFMWENSDSYDVEIVDYH